MVMDMNVVEEIDRKLLKWFGYVKREDKTQSRILEWIPARRRRNKRARINWRTIEEIGEI